MILCWVAVCCIISEVIPLKNKLVRLLDGGAVILQNLLTCSLKSYFQEKKRVTKKSLELRPKDPIFHYPDL
jgi:hypothetical protein